MVNVWIESTTYTSYSIRLHKLKIPYWISRRWNKKTHQAKCWLTVGKSKFSYNIFPACSRIPIRKSKHFVWKFLFYLHFSIIFCLMCELASSISFIQFQITKYFVKHKSTENCNLLYAILYSWPIYQITIDPNQTKHTNEPKFVTNHLYVRVGWKSMSYTNRDDLRRNVKIWNKY